MKLLERSQVALSDTSELIHRKMILKRQTSPCHTPLPVHSAVFPVLDFDFEFSILISFLSPCSQRGLYITGMEQSIRG